MAAFSLKRILVPTDFSETSAAALKYALPLAAEFGAELHVLHVLDMTAGQFFAAEMAMVPSPAIEAEARQRAEAELATLRKVVAELESSRPLQQLELNETENKTIKAFQLLTLKPELEDANRTRRKLDHGLAEKRQAQPVKPRQQAKTEPPKKRVQTKLEPAKTFNPFQ